MPKGGYRCGAGRKPLPLNDRKTSVSVYLKPLVIEALTALGGGSLSHGIEEAYSMAYDQIIREGSRIVNAPN